MRLHAVCVRTVVLFAVLSFVVAVPHTAGAASAKGTALSPLESRAELDAGNVRFREGKALHPRQGAERRLETARQGQAPIALVLACSDSREAVELLFDQGLGDLFVVRVAGNTTGTAVHGSIEYAVAHLRVPLVVVLGHTRCGAVDSVWQGGEFGGNLAGLLAPIEPAVLKVKKAHPVTAERNPSTARLLAVEENVRNAVLSVSRDNSVAREAAASNKLLILGAVYDLESGAVSWLDLPKP